MERLAALREAGVSIWLDTLSRELLETGEFAELVVDRYVTGATSNPTIFAKAITSFDRYQTELSRLLAGGEHDPLQLFLALARSRTCARPPTSSSRCTPQLRDATASSRSSAPPTFADDTEATVRQARELWARLDRPNTMIKVPATDAGVLAAERLTADG